jgi:hypothetical protein
MGGSAMILLKTVKYFSRTRIRMIDAMPHLPKDTSRISKQVAGTLVVVAVSIRATTVKTRSVGFLFIYLFISYSEESLIGETKY